MKINDKVYFSLKNKLSEKLKVKIINKKDSKLMKLISYVLFFNKNFMIKFTTTIGRTIYVSKAFEESENIAKIITLLHEFVHIQQNNEDVLHKVKYLFPQILFILAFILFPFIGFLSLFFILFAVLPLPAYFRMKSEIEAYGLNLYLFDKSGLYQMDHELQHCVQQFTTSNYFFMWPFEDKVRKELLKSWHNIVDGKPTVRQKRSLALLSQALFNAQK